MQGNLEVVLMPLRAFIDSEACADVLFSFVACVLMPLRAFIDSEKIFEFGLYDGDFLWVLMPLRAFIDSELRRCKPPF